MVRKALTAAGALLAGFHGWVFLNQLEDGRLADAGVLARWAVAGALVAALWYLRRQNVSLLWGRKAVAIWLLAAVLHGPSLTDRLTAIDTMATAEAAGVVLQVSAGALWCLLLVVAGVALRRAAATASAWRPVSHAAAQGLASRLRVTPLAPRPPPVR